MPKDSSVTNDSAPRLFFRQTPAQREETRRCIGNSGSATRLITAAEREKRLKGSRAVWTPPLVREDLYEDGVLPPPLTSSTRPHQVCSLCQQVKCHPVAYACGHSHCYACIRLRLEHDWTCPLCPHVITRAPCRHDGEEKGIAHDFPDWGNHTSVYYTWEGLTWPRRQKAPIETDEKEDF
ncbi:hypothetical protein DFH06DRAFT_1322457 [Mycena polygramma]|nr:hypothetical protein DFH06DRAFT_1322457 [Mycena polygramma]